MIYYFCRYWKGGGGSQREGQREGAEGLGQKLFPSRIPWPVWDLLVIKLKFWRKHIYYNAIVNFKRTPILAILTIFVVALNTKEIVIYERRLQLEPTLPHPFIQLYCVCKRQDQGGITFGAIDEPRKSSKAIDERVIINFRNKNVVIARFCDKNGLFTFYIYMNRIKKHFCCKNAQLRHFCRENLWLRAHR